MAPRTPITQAEINAGRDNLIRNYREENPNYRNYTAADIEQLDDVMTGDLLTVLSAYPDQIDQIKPTDMPYGVFAGLVFRRAARLREENGESVLSSEMESIIRSAAAYGSGLPRSELNVDNPATLRFNGTVRIVSVSPLGECTVELVSATTGARIVINNVQPEHIEALYLAREIGTDLVTRRAVQNIDLNIPSGTAILSRNSTLAVTRRDEGGVTVREGIDPLIDAYNEYRTSNPQASDIEAQTAALEDYREGYLVDLADNQPAVVGAMIGSEDVFSDPRSALYMDIRSDKSARELATIMEFMFNPHDGIDPTPSQQFNTLADISRRWRANGYQGQDVLGSDISVAPISYRAANDNDGTQLAAVGGNR
jgi:hypothetical protein